MTAEVGAVIGSRRKLYVASGLLVATTVTWRSGEYYAGGVDPTVAIKGLLGVIAALVAWSAAVTAPHRQRVDHRALVYIAAYGVVSMFGAQYSGNTMPSLVLVFRLWLIAFTVYELARAFPVMPMLRVLATWMTAFALFSTVTGRYSVHSGRLIGGIPPLNANEIAELCALIVLLIVWRDLEDRGRVWDAFVVFGLLGIIWLTGSRTSLIFLTVALLFLLAQARKFNTGFVTAVLATLPFLTYILLGTSLASSYFTRGGSQNLDTLSSRTVAWHAALHLHTGFWDTWFGNGLSRLEIPVAAQFRTEQILDSTWISAWVQSGVVGVAVLAIWILDTFVTAFRAERPYRVLSTSLLLFVVGRSVLESGLIGATPVYVMFMLISLTAGPARAANTRRSGASKVLARPVPLEVNAQFEPSVMDAAHSPA